MLLGIGISPQDITQLTFTCSMSTIETLEKKLNMFKVNNKNTRTTSKNCFSFDNVRPCKVTLINPFHGLVSLFTP